jgi:hypothetical protein
MLKTKVRALVAFFGLVAIALGVFLFGMPSREVAIDPVFLSTLITEEILNPNPQLNTGEEKPVLPKTQDIEPQKPLADPPKIIKAIYATNWSMSHQGKTNYLVGLADSTEINAIVIDIKDYTGTIPYVTDLQLPNKYGAVEIRIPRLHQLIKDLHDRNIYVIGRLSVFQDSALAKARPDLALVSSSTQKTWTDHKGLTWMDSSSREVWDYNIAIARDALDRGFDEINFDYIRFASDGKLSDIKYPIWDEATLKTLVMRDFYKYVRDSLGEEAKISADLFGLTTVNRDGLGIGQHLEYALPYFDAIAPMVYPSHYYPGFIGLDKPAEYPYEVIKYSMDFAVSRMDQYIASAATTTPPLRATLRPWLQDFDLGADYDAVKVRAQIQAWDDAASSTPEYSSGWMMWNAGNVYTREALNTE